MFPRFFSPTITNRLFDPMPLPRTMRVRRVGRKHVQLPKTHRLQPVTFIIKKVPYYR